MKLKRIDNSTFRNTVTKPTFYKEVGGTLSLPVFLNGYRENWQETVERNWFVVLERKMVLKCNCGQTEDPDKYISPPKHQPQDRQIKKIWATWMRTQRCVYNFSKMVRPSQKCYICRQPPRPAQIVKHFVERSWIPTKKEKGARVFRVQHWLKRGLGYCQRSCFLLSFFLLRSGKQDLSLIPLWLQRMYTKIYHFISTFSTEIN